MTARPCQAYGLYMQLDPELVVAALTESRKALGLGEILTQLQASPGQRTELKRLMRELVKQARVVKDGKRFRVEGIGKDEAGAKGADDGQTREPPLIGSRAGRAGGRFLIGTLRRHADGYGFVEPLTGRGSGYYLPAEDARRALDGDLVKVEVVEGFRGKPAGRFVDVVERRRSHLVGTLLRQGRGYFVEPLNPALGEAIPVPATHQAGEGDLVKVRITRGPTRKESAAGEIVARLGRPGDPLGEVLEAAFRYGFSDEFAADVLAEAGRAPDAIPRAELHRRRDLRSLRLVTIDGEDARDFDDAVYVERNRAGWRLVVAIADVAHYVSAGTALDFEALRRGTSVYFPSFALPMLPERLSNGLCSLKPAEDRLCLVADLVFELDGAGGVRCADAELYEGVMRSAARCTYTEVAELLAGETVLHREFLRPDFTLMEELARLLIATRGERGAIDFDLPEVKVLLDERHRPVRLEKRERNIAHRIIEEFMLAANEAVARHFAARALPTVYRVHGEPDEEKLDSFLILARAHGFALEPGGDLSGRSLNQLLKQIAGSPEQRTLNYLLLRSMMQALYSSENVGHFGLAAPHYLHFTSPIRRYPDLMVHRLLKEHWSRGARSLDEEESAQLEDRLDGVAARSSERERAAMSAEREADAYFAALFLKDKVGEEFDGVVAAVTPFGLFVELKGVFVEGLVKAEALGEGASFDEERHRMVVPRGPTFSLGTEVRVRVANVNLARRHIDFELLTVEERPVSARPAAPARSRTPRRPERPDREAKRPRRHGPKPRRRKR
ncbi:MAG: ribonuclease R [Deltaproteobacteria bacterium]|nr:ribonuclease R [Deltaproteobacteria bacterium]